jgi:hypothetical protein
LAKGGQADVQPTAQNCLQQVWPNFETSCLRNSESGVMILQARLVTARR